MSPGGTATQIRTTLGARGSFYSFFSLVPSYNQGLSPLIICLLFITRGAFKTWLHIL